MNISVSHNSGFLVISSLYLTPSLDCDINATCSSGISSFYAICDVDQITEGCQLDIIVEFVVTNNTVDNRTSFDK